MREKLIELLKESGVAFPISKANFLIANGVTIATDNNKWIPVTERLPDLELAEAKAYDFDLYACLATIKNNRARNGRYVGKVWWDGEIFINADCTDVTHDVTHWMPLPEPAKGE
jgi:hypothetical protein